MNIEAEVEVFVVLIGRKSVLQAGEMPKYEYAGVAATARDALAKGAQYLGVDPYPMMTWRTPSYATAPVDFETAIFIRKEVI